MEKEAQHLKKEDSDFLLKGKATEEVLELSSTGYGFESVTVKHAKKTNKDNSSCGGL